MERRFRLQPVLNYRANVEEILQLELARLLADEQAARAHLGLLRAESDRAMVDTARLQAAGAVDVAAVEQGFVYLGALQEAIGRQLDVLAAVTQRVEAKRREVIAAMQDRKIMEKLKQRHDRAYDVWARQVEQRLVDDMVTVRYNRRAAAGEEEAW